jgi:hypothetical protein
MTCEEFDRLEARYLSRATSGDETAMLELHAAECAVCGPRLEAVTRRDVSSFAPPLPPHIRERTLAAVHERKRARPRSHVWQYGGFAAAAAIVAMVLINAPATRDPIAPSSPSLAGADSLATTSAFVLATRSSRGEFEALDEAAREIQSALASTPDDPELRQFLAAIQARRAELERRVKDAS